MKSWNRPDGITSSRPNPKATPNPNPNPSIHVSQHGDTKILPHSTTNEQTPESNMAHIDFQRQQRSALSAQRIPSKPLPSKPPLSPAASAPPPNLQSTSNSANASGSGDTMAAVGGKCTHAGCQCTTYKESTSKWSKGKCKTCTHTLIQHKKVATATISYDKPLTAKPPRSATPNPAMPGQPMMGSFRSQSSSPRTSKSLSGSANMQFIPNPNAQQRVSITRSLPDVSPQFGANGSSTGRYNHSKSC